MLEEWADVRPFAATNGADQLLEELLHVSRSIPHRAGRLSPVARLNNLHGRYTSIPEASGPGSPRRDPGGASTGDALRGLAMALRRSPCFP